MRWAWASEHSSGPFEPIGFWINIDLAQIRKDLEERLDYEKIEILFSDGGPGIEENLLWPGMYISIVSGMEKVISLISFMRMELKSKNSVH